MDPIQGGESKNPENPSLKQIRTFQGDVVEALQKQRGSLVSIQQAERSKRGPLQIEAEQDNSGRKRILYLSLGSFILIVMGLGGAWYAYTAFVSRTTAPTTTVPINRLISVNDTVDLTIATTTSRQVLITKVSDALENTPEGEAKHLVLRKDGVVETNSLYTISEFLDMIESRAPSNLVRAFKPMFMLGALGESAFLIIELSSFENAYAGMLAWESTISQDIGPIFPTSDLLRNVPPETLFIDITDRNKDVRALQQGEEMLLVYSFLEKEALVISDDLLTLRAVVDRLTREKLSR